MLETIRQTTKELIIILVMVQVVILLLRMIIPRSVKRGTKVLMKGSFTLGKLIFAFISFVSGKGYQLYKQSQKAKQPAVTEQAAGNIIPFPLNKRVAK